ncbi:MAG: hypothetical protein OEX18_11705 [Candidatus Krumholzibacteria bacterium]|nr:hypothetical protein [Candidatus Krumholzibacteria bacterium]MDH4337927.1 hypothetical protein [Candidatus Krumholzibacteria bacterium]MDH5270327.1 hypothetical protein [Candidatus Krumholzibacteria bacterium]MDH5626248.1 hypothetical protein [Nitrospira sp.]
MPTGWNISVHRQVNGGAVPATFGAELGETPAVWQTDFLGLSWLDALVRENLAINLGGNGYPMEFTARASQIIPQLRRKPPGSRDPWAADSHDILGHEWLGKTTKSPEVISACDPEEWLVVQAWDES